jgi:hypothetical protein
MPARRKAWLDGGPDRCDDHPVGNFRGRPSGFRRFEEHFDGRNLPEQFI